MRTTCISLLMAALMALPHTVTAQTSLRDIFIQMPDSLLPTLSRSDRLDLLDFIDANLTNEVPGALRGSARLTMLTPSVLKLRLSPHAEMQMCLLSAIDMRQKQVATLLGISPQNLRNQRLRLLSRIKGQPCVSISDFAAWIESCRS